MSQAAAGEPSAERGATAASVPTVGGVALTDLSAGLGGLAWVGAVASGELGAIDRALALAPLVLAPLGLEMVARPHFEGVAGRLYRAAVVLQPVGAGLLLASLLVPPGALAAGLATLWVGVTGLLALTAAARVRERGAWPVTPGRSAAETLLDAALAYPTVASAALVFSHLGVTFRFDPVIVLLTAVHFHYAGFVLPVVAGLAGRTLARPPPRTFRAVAGVVLVGPVLIGIGISFSPLVEVVAVGGFTVAVAGLGASLVVRIAPSRRRLQGVCLGAAGLALPVSMALALGYGIGAFTGRPPLGIDVGRMVALHGSVNALGFGLLGIVGWRLAVPGATAANEH